MENIKGARPFLAPMIDSSVGADGLKSKEEACSSSAY